MTGTTIPEPRTWTLSFKSSYSNSFDRVPVDGIYGDFQMCCGAFTIVDITTAAVRHAVIKHPNSVKDADILIIWINSLIYFMYVVVNKAHLVIKFYFVRKPGANITRPALKSAPIC